MINLIGQRQIEYRLIYVFISIGIKKASLVDIARKSCPTSESLLSEWRNLFI